MPAFRMFDEETRKRVAAMVKEVVAEVVRLTGREAEVLRLIAFGCTHGQVADRLGMSVLTVGTHVKNAYRKLGVHSAAAAVMRAIQLRLLQIE